MSKKTLKPVVMAAGAVMIGSLALSGTAFAMSPLAQGYLLAAGTAAGDDKPTEGSCGEGRCGEGQCGADKPAETAAAAGTDAAMTPTADGKAADGTCGEGQCGADMEAADDAAAADDKAHAEGTCNG